MPEVLDHGLADVAETFANEVSELLSQKRWAPIQLLVNQVNEIDPERYQLRVTEANYKTSHIALAIVDLKQMDDQDKPQQTFSFHTNPKVALPKDVMKASFSEYQEGRVRSGTPKS